MALVFNPFTGNFDNVMASSSDMSMSGGTLTVNGDIALDSGGAFTTTVQAVTPTANRTISFPDQTGTVGLVSGATGNIQYNNAGQLAGTGDLNTELDWTNSLVTYTGLKVNVTDTGSAAGSNLIDIQSNGTSQVVVDDDGNVGIGTTSPGAALDIYNATSGDQLRISNATNVYYRIGRGTVGGLLEFYGTQSSNNGYIFGGADGERMRIKSNGAIRYVTAFTVGTLPTGEVGDIARVTDGDSGLTFGQTVVNTGGGGTPYLCWYNGTNWTVIGA